MYTLIEENSYTNLGEEGNQIGDFIEPCGITISPQGRIIVTSNNPNHSPQLLTLVTIILM